MSRTKIPKEDIFAKMQDLGYTILDEFKNTKCSVNFRCKRGHTWKIQVANVYREMSGCPECARPSSEASSIFIRAQQGDMMSQGICRNAFMNQHEVLLPPSPCMVGLAY